MQWENTFQGNVGDRMPRDSEDKEKLLAELVAAYEQSLLANSAPSVDDYVRSYPNIAEELRRQINIGSAMRMHLKAQNVSPERVSTGLQKLLETIDPNSGQPSGLENQTEPRSAGDLIAKTRRGKGIRVSALAQAIGGSEDEVRRIEADQWSSGEESLLKKILAFLGIANEAFMNLMVRPPSLEAPAYYRRKEDRNREKPRG